MYVYIAFVYTPLYIYIMSTQKLDYLLMIKDSTGIRLPHLNFILRLSKGEGIPENLICRILVCVNVSLLGLYRDS